MILIADSGSTKTDWVLLQTKSDTILSNIKTQGINPVFLSRDRIRAVICEELIPHLSADSLQSVSEIYFYGAGCREEFVPSMESLLRELFPHAREVSVNSDMLGAACAVCGHKEGLACILGTGMNSCLFDGNHMTKNVPSLGFILGDEGSGAVMGKLLLNNVYKGFFKEQVKEELERTYQLSISTIIQRVYREPMPSRFLASLALFVHDHLNDDQVKQMVIDNFRSFFQKNIILYHRPDLEVGAVGSVAFYFKEQLIEAAQLEGIRMGRMMKSPINGLIEYHSHKT